MRFFDSFALKKAFSTLIRFEYTAVRFDKRATQMSAKAGADILPHWSWRGVSVSVDQQLGKCKSMEEIDPSIVEQRERLELEAVAASLQRTPKMENLLRYLARWYFAGENGELTEYNIATEVFGRKKTGFIASEDSIARVQTHRLRKKLKEYYDNEGRDHLVRISIPLGGYAPVFSHREIAGCTSLEQPQLETMKEGEAPKIEHLACLLERDTPLQSIEPESRSTHSQPTPQKSGLQAVVFAGLVAALVVLMLGIALARRGKLSSALAGTEVAGSAHQTLIAPNWGTVPTSSAGVAVPFRLIAGYDGPPEVDSAGNIWQADEYFHNGWRTKQSLTYVTRTADPIIFRYGRSGDSDYDIPLRPGTYELHLYLFQPSQASQSEDLEEKAIFNVTINGVLALAGFDIVSDALGRNIADERVFRDISPAPDGKLHLHISTVVGTPSLSAIEILQGTPHKQLPIRLVTQTTPYTDRMGQLWRPDNYFWSGRYLVHSLPGIEASDLDLPPAERYGHFSYAIPVDTRDRYTLVLHFTELFFGVDEPGGPGKRVFRVLCNGTTLLDDFDIYKETGALHTIEKTFHHLKPTAQGKLNISFEPINNYATVTALEIIDESN